jgi:hypothetical protein
MSVDRRFKLIGQGFFKKVGQSIYELPDTTIQGIRIGAADGANVLIRNLEAYINITPADSTQEENYILGQNSAAAINIWRLTTNASGTRGGGIRLDGRNAANTAWAHLIDHDRSANNLYIGDSQLNNIYLRQPVRINTDDDSLFMGAGSDWSMTFDSVGNLEMRHHANFSTELEDSGGLTRFAFDIHATTSTSNQLHMYRGARTRWLDSTNADAVACAHDGTDFNWTSANTTAMTFDMLLQPELGMTVTGGPFRTSTSCKTIFNASELTIAAGAITVTGTNHTVDTQFDSAIDDLDTINGATANGQILFLHSANSARDTTVRDQSVSGGNIELDGATAFTFSNVRDILMLMYHSATGKWVEISRANNG